MSRLFNARRAFFVGKTGKIIRILAVIALLGYPAIIQADTVPATTTTQPQSTIPVAPADVVATKTVWVTAYTSAPDETSSHPLITASGGMVHDGVVAANFLPFGTQIEIPALFGNKIFTVEDRTSAKFGGRVDIWMPTVNQAVNFGIEHAQIVILDQNLALQ
jgi:3D (Asp-Asp-Asp) domain-containing protein